MAEGTAGAIMPQGIMEDGAGEDGILTAPADIHIIRIMVMAVVIARFQDTGKAAGIPYLQSYTEVFVPLYTFAYRCP